ncbi:hypothetical protein [Roseibacillus ishigakijimensis]|uniref:hypothetical protein n=1 Tax=Roseibacillus ishigakijimensis TaxID=454146 RepID=UPI001903A830|nr:hypothetical protein [Roseibacillus ishigakijimensis]
MALKTGGAPAPSGTAAPKPAATVPLKVGGGPAPQLGGSPKPTATVPLKSGGTSQLGAPTGTGMQSAPATIGGFDDDDEAEENGTITSVLAILALVAALAVFASQFLTAKTWVDTEEPQPRDWSQYFEL